MTQSKASRVMAAIFMGLMLGLFIHFRQMRELSLGREGFLAERSHYFDQITKVHSTVYMLAAGIILASIAIGLYELVAAVITRLVPPSDVEE